MYGYKSTTIKYILYIILSISSHSLIYIELTHTSHIDSHYPSILTHLIHNSHTFFRGDPGGTRIGIELLVLFVRLIFGGNGFIF